MKNIKKLLALPLTVLALYGLTACKPMTKPPASYEASQGSYRWESLAKESQIRMYNTDGKLIAKKSYKDNTPTYEFYDNNGKVFAEVKLKEEIVSLKEKDKTTDIVGNMTLFEEGALEKGIKKEVKYDMPLWRDDVTNLVLRGYGGYIINGNIEKRWYNVERLFALLLSGEKLLEAKYDKEF